MYRAFYCPKLCALSCVRAFLELDPEPRLPFGWEKCFDVKTGLIFFKNASNGTRTSNDPRVHQQEGVDSKIRPCLARSLSCAASNQQGDKREGWTSWIETSTLEGAEKFTMGEKLSSWKRTHRSKKLPPLLSLNSNDSLLSLELSLRLEGPRARESTNIQFASSNTPETRREIRCEKADKFKVEQLEECVQNFLGRNHIMGPFPSTLATVKEEINATSFFWNQPPGVCMMEPSSFPKSASEERERAEVPAGTHLEQFKLQDFLGLNYNVGSFSSNDINVKEESRQEPMPSSQEQSAVSCTLEKIQLALKRSQFDCKADSNALPTQSNNSIAHLTWCTKSTLLSSLRPLRTPLTDLPSRSLSPTTSDASSAASSKSSRHSSTSPSVMSFQGEELDDLGALASNSDASPSSLAFHSSNSKAHGEDPSVLVTVGCTSCLMFFMLSKDNPSCPKCGSTGLLEILPTSISPRKRQRMESINVVMESRTRWDADDC